MEDKCVLIVDENLPLGAIANAAAVLAMSIAKKHPEIVGADLPDIDGYMHQGITTFALPILKGNGELLQRLRQQLKEFEPALFVVDVISATRTTKSYEEYAEVLKNSPAKDIEYLGIGLFGSKKLVTKFTGSLGLLR